MRGFVELLRRFRSDERGAFLVVFAVLGVVLIATAGAVVDFTAIEQARTRAQQALDSAALGLQPTIYDTPTPTSASLKTKALSLVRERLNDSAIVSTVDTATVNTTEGTLRLEGTITVKTNFVQLVGISTVRARLLSEATRKQLNLEVVMVLDNSNSMDSYSRQSNLEAAAACLSNILFNDSCTSTATTTTKTNVKLGIVPFTLQVNVGTSNASATWLDRSGNVSSHATRTPATQSKNITNDNFDSNDNDTDVFNGTVDRIALMNQLGGVDWGGCVEARKYPYDTNDDLPVAGTDTMFTPMFAPDEPDTGGFSNNYLADRPASCTSKDLASWTHVQNKFSCTKSGTSQNNYDTASCNNSTTNSYAQKDSNGSTVTASTTQPASIGGNAASCETEYEEISRSGNGNNRRYQNRRTITCLYQFSQRELQERLCKYTGATASGINQASVKGPNGDCPVNAITPLTTNKPTITAAITALDPQGGTNIHAGAIWGFHVLSPTAPFTQGIAYDTATSKVMILMTDGENTAYGNSGMNGTTYYSYYGYPYNERLGDLDSSDSDLESLMNSRLADTCTNIKAAGIKLYTVGLSVNQTSNPTTNTNLLKNCSSGTGYWYFPTAASELTTVFQDIANQLSNLRLAK